MSEAKRIDEPKRVVVDGYPAERLPEDVRRDIDPSHKVRVIVEDGPQLAVTDFEEKLLKYWGAASYLGTTSEEAVARIRALRDEQD